MVKMPKAVCSVSAIALAAFAVTASAQEGAASDPGLEPIAIRVTGFAGCPSGEEFWRRLQVRAPSIRLTRPGEPGRVFVVQFQESEPGRAIGRLRVLDVEGSTLDREISGTTCNEVADALSLIAAVAARGAFSPDETPSPGPTQVVAPRPSPAPPAPTFGTAPPSIGEPASSWDLLVLAHTSLRTGIVPSALYGAGAGFELVHDGPSVWHLAAGATIDATLRSTASTEGVVAGTEMSGQLTMVHLFASPLRLRAGPVDVRPYAALDFGRLNVEGRGNGLSREGENRMFWLAAALSMQIDVRLGGGWRVGAGAGAEMHPFLYQYVYTNRDVYQVGDIGLVANFALAYRFE